MTLITRLKGTKQSIIAADDQVNASDDKPFQLDDGTGILKIRKVFIPGDSSISFSISNFIGNDKVDLLGLVKDSTLSHTYTSPKELAEHLVALMKNIDEPSLIPQSVEFLISGVDSKHMVNLALLKRAHEFSIIEEGITKGLFSEMLLKRYCTLFDRIESDYLEVYGSFDLLASVDFNYSYIPQVGAFSPQCHPWAFYSILVIVAVELGIELSPVGIDALSEKEIIDFMRSYYSKLIELRDIQEIEIGHMALLKSFGPISILSKIDVSGANFLINSDIN